MLALYDNNMQKIINYHNLVVEIHSQLDTKITEEISSSKQEILDLVISNSLYDSRLTRSIQRMINIAFLHHKVFPKYKNIHNGRDIVLLATGKSAELYNKMIENAVHIGVNRAFMMKNIKLNYLFCQDYGKNFVGKQVGKDYLQQLDTYRYDDLKIFLGILHEEFGEGRYIPESIAIKYNAERYYTFPWFTVPHAQFQGTLHVESEVLADSGSVSFPAFQFALYTNPKRIFLVGQDCSQTGYFDGETQLQKPDWNILINGWKAMKKFADENYPETEIISVNPVALKGIFTDIKT
jgi:hypothetical protein